MATNSRVFTQLATPHATHAGGTISAIVSVIRGPALWRKSTDLRHWATEWLRYRPINGYLIASTVYGPQTIHSTIFELRRLLDVNLFTLMTYPPASNFARPVNCKLRTVRRGCCTSRYPVKSRGFENVKCSNKLKEYQYMSSAGKVWRNPYLIDSLTVSTI